MYSPSEKLAESLRVLQLLQDTGLDAIRSAELTRTHRERLLRNGFLVEVVRGWYIPTRPSERAGDSTAWYTSFWRFCAAYLTHRFEKAWCLSPEQSLRLHVGNRTVPAQLLVYSPKGSNKPLALPHGTSIFDVRNPLPDESRIIEQDGLRIYSLPAALVACPAAFFRRTPTDARAALAMLRDASDVLAILLEGGHSSVAGRLAGALRNIGRNRSADEIVSSMRAAGYGVRESDPFDEPAPVLSARESSPYVNRVRLMWQVMRAPIIESFPKAPGTPQNSEAYLKACDDAYVADAYHSLSIEGYRVSPALIERVRAGAWRPDSEPQDREQRDALAARGYWQAFQAVRASVTRVLGGENPGSVCDDDHGNWYRELFAPSVVAGLVAPRDLAGYRNDQVYIRRSMHVPPRREAVRDLMPAFFDLLREEVEAGVRVVLGHFIFVYIHPYMDGNGRMARFLMNVTLASGGYPWTVIPLTRRDDYMAALEAASVRQEIRPFAEFLAELVAARLRGGPTPAIPEASR